MNESFFQLRGARIARRSERSRRLSIDASEKCCALFPEPTDAVASAEVGASLTSMLGSQLMPPPCLNSRSNEKVCVCTAVVPATLICPSRVLVCCILYSRRAPPEFFDELASNLGGSRFF